MSNTGESERAENRYGAILKSTSLIGGSSLVNILMSIIRLKVLAVLLGPAGVGLFGLYNVIIDLGASIVGLGIQASGVRQVALANASGDADKVARVAKTLSRASLLLGVVGMILLIGLAVPVASLSFGTPAHAGGVMLVSVAVLLRILAGAPMAIIQGSRRIGDLARMTVLGAVLNTAVAIPLVYWLGEAGIVPSLIAVAATTWLAAIWYCRRIALPRVSLSLSQFSAETKGLVRLGFAFMASGLLMTGSAFLIRILVVQELGVDAAGNYQAAWALGGIYVGFVLQAMGTDFYPRLSGVADDDVAVTGMVNEQARISLLLAGPGLLATLALSPLVMALFYSSEFAGAVPVLRWFCLGMLLRVVAWPMGFIILAKGKQQIFFWTELAAAAVQVGLTWLLLDLVGLTGAGMAFAGLYLWHGLLIHWIVRKGYGFAWSRENLVLGAGFVGATVLALAAVELLPFLPGLGVAVAVTAVASWYSLSQLIALVPQRWIPRWLPKVVRAGLGLKPTPMASAADGA